MTSKKSSPITSQPTKARPVILAASTACLAIIGAWYGANLKENQEIKQKETARREATQAERIAILEQTKSGLMAKKVGLEDKIAQLELRATKAGEQREVQGRPLHGFEQERKG